MVTVEGGCQEEAQKGKGKEEREVNEIAPEVVEGSKEKVNSQLQANSEQSPFVSRFPRHRHRSLNKMTEALTIQTVFKDRKLSSQFIEETIEIPVSAQKQTEFGRS